MADITVEEFCRYVAPDVWDSEDLLAWPPDVFAVAASLLLKSGAYAHAVSNWQRKIDLPKWEKDLRAIGDAWRIDAANPPPEVGEWHTTLIDNRSTPVFGICADHGLCDALLRLCAAADEACRGVGCTLSSPKTAAANPDADARAAARQAFLEDASTQLLASTLKLNVSTLCKKVHHSTVRVLPKLHTPQSGITIRSLTHNLALCPAGDVKAKWAECLSTKRHCLNILLAPWPLKVTPAHFQSVDQTRAVLPEIAEGFGFFEYNPADEKSPASGLRGLINRMEDDTLFKRLQLMLQNAKEVVPSIDGVIFPELALTPNQYKQISEALMSEQPGIFLICGVRDRPSPPDNMAGQNYLRFDIPFINPQASQSQRPMSHRQDKHHRWRLDKRQIVQYGLGSSLDVAMKWWEHTAIGNRELYFVVLDDWLTICPLICEDLARQDPIAELVRSVGPNLVIALLMDGPQLASRWPARYATVLADDPGSSVLTLTSAGMAELSRPPSVTGTSRAVALWKDAKTGEAVSIELPPNMEGIVLSLSRQFVNEWSADGRSDGGTTGYPTLSGIHYVTSGLAS